MFRGILAFDIDGTLTHKLDWIAPEIVDYLSKKSNDGWLIALVTGRIFSFSWQILKLLDFPFCLAVQNGADILHMPEKKSLKRQYFSKEVVEELKKAYEKESEDFIIYAGVDRGDFCYYRKNRFSKKMLKYLDILKSYSAAEWVESDFHFEDETFPLIKCFGNKEPMQKLNQKLLKLSEIEVSMIQDPVDTSLYLNLITHPNAHKGDAIEFIRSHYKTPFVIAAGDQQNDFKMIQEADVKVVIETAPKSLLEMADLIAKPPEELGIIEAVEEAIKHAPR